MKNKVIFLTAFMVSFLFLKCEQEPIESPKNDIIESTFPNEINEWGKSFAANLNCATIEAKQNQQLKNVNISSHVSVNYEKIDEFNSSVSKFSKKQLEILGKIAKAKNKSKSYIAFSKRLAKINNEIHKNVPKNEQDRLFYITSALYYGLKEINNLVRDGVLPGNPEGEGLTLSSLVRLKCANTEEDPEESSWWNDPESLAGVWALAVAEPTPVGEAVALVLTGIVGSYYVITRADCIAAYVDCVLYSSNNNCSDCLHYCIVQGNWNCN